MRTLRFLAATLLLPLLAASCADAPPTSPEKVVAPVAGPVRSHNDFYINCPATLAVGEWGYCSAWSWSGGLAYPTSWSSSSGAVWVTSSGSVYAAAPGYATISASGDGYTAYSGVSVYDAQPSYVASVTVSSASIYLGWAAQLTARVYDQHGNQMTGQSVAWSIDDEGVATINGSGMVMAQSVGSTTARATVDGVEGSGTVSVHVPPEPEPGPCPACPHSP